MMPPNAPARHQHRLPQFRTSALSDHDWRRTDCRLGIRGSPKGPRMSRLREFFAPPFPWLTFADGVFVFGIAPFVFVGGNEAHQHIEEMHDYIDLIEPPVQP